jgi:hypothetical protein
VFCAKVGKSPGIGNELKLVEKLETWKYNYCVLGFEEQINNEQF